MFQTLQLRANGLQVSITKLLELVRRIKILTSALNTAICQIYKCVNISRLVLKEYLPWCCRVGESLAFTLKAFVELMDHSIVSWDVLEPKFIKIVSPNRLLLPYHLLATFVMTSLELNP